MQISSSMIGSVMMPSQSFNQNQQTLTDEQKTTVEEILSGYDSKNLTQEDFEDILQEFAAAGITPSDSLKATVEESEFDFSEFIQAGGMPPGPPPGGMGMMPPPPASNVSDSEEEDDYTTQLAELLEAYDNGEADQSDFEAFIESIRASSTSSTGNILHSVA